MIPTLPLMLLLGAQAPLYGDDLTTLITRRLGYEERLQPCSVKDGDVEIALRSAGDIIYNGVRKSAAEFSKGIHAGRLDIRSVCLYVEGPMSPAAKSALRLIWSVVSGSDLGIVRYIDPEFLKQVVPKFPSTRTK